MDRQWFRIVATAVVAFLAGICLVFAGLLLRPGPAPNALTDFLGMANSFLGMANSFAIRVGWMSAPLALVPVLAVVSFLINRFRRKTSPPLGLLIDLLIPPNRADDMVNNLLGAYERWVKKYGARVARRIFVVQSVLVILTYWVDWLLRRVKLLKLLRRSPP